MSALLTPAELAMPSVPHPGGRLERVVAHYQDGSKQTIDGDVIIRALIGWREATKEKP